MIRKRDSINFNSMSAISDGNFEFNREIHDFVTSCYEIPIEGHREQTHGAGDTPENDNTHDADSVAKSPTVDYNATLLKAAFLGRVDIISKCLAKGATPDFRDGVGRLALHYAVVGGHLAATKVLLEAHPTSVNVADKKQWAPLHIAIAKVYPETVKLLLSFGADVNAFLRHACAPCRGGPTQSKPIHFAAMKGSLIITNMLIESGVSVNDRDKDNRTALHYAAFRNNLPYVKYLLDCGAVPAARDKQGRTPLHVAALTGQKEIGQLLVAAGCPIEWFDSWDMTAEDIAYTRQHLEMRSWLGEQVIDAAQIRRPVSDDAVRDSLIRGLNESNEVVIERAVARMGTRVCLDIYHDTRQIEEAGGLMTCDGHNRRTPGGTFLYLVRSRMWDGRLSREDWDYIRQVDKESANSRKLKQRRLRRRIMLSQLGKNPEG